MQNTEFLKITKKFPLLDFYSANSHKYLLIIKTAEDFSMYLNLRQQIVPPKYKIANYYLK